MQFILSLMYIHMLSLESNFLAPLSSKSASATLAIYKMQAVISFFAGLGPFLGLLAAMQLHF